jgi:hypothetical protein
MVRTVEGDVVGEHGQRTDGAVIVASRLVAPRPGGAPFCRSGEPAFPGRRLR